MVAALPAETYIVVVRILMVTTEYPTPERPDSGLFVVQEAESLRRLGIAVELLRFRSAANPINHALAWLRMRAMIDRGDFDVLHAQFGQAALVAGGQTSLPVVVTYRGSDVLGIHDRSSFSAIRGAVLLRASRWIARRADQIIVVSDEIRRALPREDAHVIPSAVDLDRFRPIDRAEARRALGWSPDRRVALFGAVRPDDPRKRQELARAAIEHASKSLEVELRVATGVPNEQMPLWYNASDVLLFTSRVEGSPNVVKEALACNLPVVSVPVGDVASRLESVRPGAMCEPNPESLGRGLVEVLRDPTRSNGRSVVLDLSLENTARRIRSVYERALENRSRPARGAPPSI